MKPFVLPLILLAILLANMITQNPYLTNVAIFMAWFKIVLFVVMSILVFVVYTMNLTSRFANTPIKQEKIHQSLLVLIQVANTILMAAMGWIITAIVYAIAYAFLTLLVTVIKVNSTQKD